MIILCIHLTFLHFSVLQVLLSIMYYTSIINHSLGLLYIKTPIKFIACCEFIICDKLHLKKKERGREEERDVGLFARLILSQIVNSIEAKRQIDRNEINVLHERHRKPGEREHEWHS